MWKEGETNSKYPRMFISSANNIKPSTYWLQDASYLRLKNLQIGYTIPRKILSHTFLDGVRVYFSAQNLFTFDKMTEGMIRTTSYKSTKFSAFVENLFFWN